MFVFFGCKAYGILSLQPGIKPGYHELEGKLLTTEPPGKSHEYPYKQEARARARTHTHTQLRFA